MGRKKKDLEDAFFADFDALDEEGNVKEENEPAAPPTNKKEKKDKKNKKKGNNKKSLSNAFNSDDEGPELSLGMIPGGAQKNANDAKDSTEEEGEEEGEDNDQPLIAPPASTRRNGKKQKQKTSAFALLMEDEEGEDGGSSDEGQDADGDIQGDNDRGGLVVGQVLSVEPHPKADRLKICRIDAGQKQGILKVVTNVASVEEGMLTIVAPVGSTTPGSGLHIERSSLRGVESQGMLCSGYDIGWSAEQDGVLAVLSPGSAHPGEACPANPPERANQPGAKKKKSKEKKATSDMDSAFAALGLEEDGDDDEKNEEQKPKKKKGKKKKVDDSLFAALAEDDDGQSEEGGAEGTESEDTIRADVKLDNNFAEMKKDKKKKKKASKGKDKKEEEEEEDLDALLAEIDGPRGALSATQASLPSEEPEAKEAEAKEAEAKEDGNKKKDKKKKKASKGKDKKEEEEEEEDLDALLAELGMGGESKGESKPTSDQAQAQSAEGNGKAMVDDAPHDNETKTNQEEEEGEEEEESTTAGMSAAAKKKAKRKAKEKAKKAEEEPQGSQTGAGKGKTGKVSAAVRKMQEALEAKRRAEEEAARLAEEQRLKEEEEERRREEEEQRKKEEVERRKAEKAARREQLKREGKLLTGKAKAEAERIARAREQLLRQAGIDVSEIAPKKKPVYGKKKPQQKKIEIKQEPAEPVEPAEPAEPAEATQNEEPAKEEPTPAAEATTAPSTDTLVVEESWEDVAARDDWEEMAEELTSTSGPTSGQQVDVKVAEKANAEEQAEKSSSEDEEDEDEESSSEDEDDDDDEYSSSEEDDEYSSSEEEEEEEEDEMEARLAAARERREARLREALAHRDPADLRSPICCILGHVDTGKTKILDNIRRTNVQDGEAGGITQQIGATYIPGDALQSRTEELRKGRSFELKLPGLLVIDTPGHESFSNLRSRGSGLCDIAVLVVDLMHGLEQQTIESINLLRMRKTPFIIAMNKVDRLYGWKTVTNSPIQDAMARQDAHTLKEFDHRLNQVVLQLNEQGLNVALYWKNKDPKTFVNIVPTSAITGEGIPDLLQLLVKLTQSLMVERLMFVPELQCTVLEVKQIEGLGTTIDVVLVNGALKEGDTIVVCGLGGAIVTTIKALLTPQPLREIRVKGQYVHHKELRAAMGVKIAAHNLESAVAGTQLYVVNPGDDVEALKAEAMEDMQDIFSSVDKTGEGVAVQASTLGSLEALLEFLKSPDVAIPVSAINIGPVHKKDVMRANVMMERGMKKYGVILAFDVPVTKEAREQAEDLGVKIFTADIIYHLFDQFTAYLKQVKLDEQEAAKADAVFPCVLRIIPECVFNKKDPIIVGVEVVEGIAKVGCPLCVPSQGKIDLGRIAGLEKDHKAVEKALPGDKVAMKIEATKPEEAARLYGRHFDHNDALVSRISRKSIDVLKEMFRDELGKEDWKLVIRLKKVFNID